MRVGEETIELRGVGQRDHSWGTRDWWSAEWMWSAGHLDDGTRLHGVEFRLPGAPPVGVGYLQPPDGGVRGARRRQRLGDRSVADGLIAEAQIVYGELTLTSSRSRSARCGWRRPTVASRSSRVRCAACAREDGRAGVAWVEWNRNLATG